MREKWKVLNFIYFIKKVIRIREEWKVIIGRVS